MRNWFKILIINISSRDAISVELDKSDCMGRFVDLNGYKRTTREREIDVHFANIERRYTDSTIRLILRGDVKAKMSWELCNRDQALRLK